MDGPVIHVLPLDELRSGEPGDAPHRSGAAGRGDDPLEWAANRRFMPSGRAALDAVLAELALAPGDEVLITNASGQTYVSACVTCTVFNHCRPSRVLTDRTRAILAIHEYGYPHPELPALVALARARGIALIEDCAHSLDSSLDGVPLGSFGDYAIFSLSKVLPVPAGGILIGRDALPELDPGAGADARTAYAEHLPALAAYSARRRCNAEAICAALPALPLLMARGPGVTPWYVGVLTPEASEIRRRCQAVEWGSTLHPDLLLITTNPFAEPAALTRALESAFR